MVLILTNWIWKLAGNYELDKVFEYSDLCSDSPKPNRHSTEDPETDYGDDEVFEHRDIISGHVKAAHRNLLPPNNPIEDPDDTISMAKFDMMRSSPPPESAAIDAGFLTSATNWDRGSTREIFARMPEVARIRRAINEHLGLKARPWQVSVVADITQKKRDVCALASTNAGKSLVYQAIPIVTGGSVLVISPTIALMEDQVSLCL